MDYFEILNLTREPFSNSPDPDVFFYQSRQHVTCLQKIEVEVRLCRGLNVVIGDVGTGKTTLCRRLIRNFSNDDRIETHLILDPHFSNPLEFLSSVSAMFGLRPEAPGNELTQWTYKEGIKNYLYKRGIDAERTIVLIIDEGQKLPWFCLEILREFLNYETNEKKLLQIVIFAQEEFRNSINALKNFSDRINLLHILGPLNFRDTRAMIRYRLELASSGERKPELFTFLFLWEIYRASGGYPRKVINLCHRAVLTMIVQNKQKAGRNLARFCVRSVFPGLRRPVRLFRLAALGTLLILLTAYVLSQERLYLFPRVDSPGEGESSFANANAEKHTYPVPAKGLQTADAPDSIKSGSVQVPFPGRQEIASPGTSGQSECPEMLGDIDVPRGETLGSMILAIYGVYSPGHEKKIMECNDQLTDPDRLMPGMCIRFPALRIQPARSDTSGYRVQLSAKDNISDAYRFIKNNRGKGLGVKLVPVWSPHNGLKFVILSRTLYKEEESARLAAKTLRERFGFGASVHSGWNRDAVFFADPTS